jgi:hypothetical protein
MHLKSCKSSGNGACACKEATSRVMVASRPKVNFFSRWQHQSWKLWILPHKPSWTKHLHVKLYIQGTWTHTLGKLQHHKFFHDLVHSYFNQSIPLQLNCISYIGIKPVYCKIWGPVLLTLKNIVFWEGLIV